MYILYSFLPLSLPPLRIPSIQANRLRCTLDVCISSVTIGNDNLDLISAGEDVSEGCPDNHCQIKTSFTFFSNYSSVSFPIEETVTSNMKLQLSFQTR